MCARRRIPVTPLRSKRGQLWSAVQGMMPMPQHWRSREPQLPRGLCREPREAKHGVTPGISSCRQAWSKEATSVCL